MPSSWGAMVGKYRMRSICAALVMIGQEGTGIPVIVSYGPLLYGQLGFSASVSLYVFPALHDMTLLAPKIHLLQTHCSRMDHDDVGVLNILTSTQVSVAHIVSLVLRSCRSILITYGIFVLLTRLTQVAAVASDKFGRRTILCEMFSNFLRVSST